MSYGLVNSFANFISSKFSVWKRAIKYFSQEISSKRGLKMVGYWQSSKSPRKAVGECLQELSLSEELANLISALFGICNCYCICILSYFSLCLNFWSGDKSIIR